MTIEPISSIMTYQAQSTQPAKPVVPATGEGTEAIPQESVTAYDPTTVKVASAEREDSSAGQGGGNGTPMEQQKAQNEKIKKAVEQLNKSMQNSEAIFGIHEATNRVTIKIVDKDTKEVIKEVPAEETLDMIAKAWELAGLLVDEKR